MIDEIKTQQRSVLSQRKKNGEDKQQRQQGGWGLLIGSLAANESSRKGAVCRPHCRCIEKSFSFSFQLFARGTRFRRVGLVFYLRALGVRRLFFLLSSGRSSQVGGFGVATVDGWADPVVVFQFVGFALAPFQRKLRLPDDLQNRKDNEKMRK